MASDVFRVCPLPNPRPSAVTIEVRVCERRRDGLIWTDMSGSRDLVDSYGFDLERGTNEPDAEGGA